MSVAAAEHMERVPVPAAATAPATKGGPLVAVCGLCGGAGASTVAFLLAAASARSGAERGAVLACDAGSTTGGLALYAGTASPRSLAETALALREGRLGREPMFVRTADDLRLIAPAPRPGAEVDADAIRRIVGDARAAHRLTVVDCGTLAEEPQRIAYAMATHVIWVVPATPGGVLRARRMLDGAAPDADGRREILVARRDAGDRKAPTRDLTKLADARHAPLVLMPHAPDLAEQRLDEALDAVQVTLAALTGALRR